MQGTYAHNVRWLATIRVMAKPFERIYTHEQEDAIEYAALDRGVKPMRRICELAQAGELTNRAGEKLPAFTVPIGQVRAVKLKANKRRLGLAKTKLAGLPHREAADELARRLVAMADAGTEAMAKRQAKAQGRIDDWPELREAARAVREINAIPGQKHASTTPRPGTKTDGHQNEGPTRGGAAGTLLRAMRSHNATPAEETETDQDDARTSEDRPEGGGSGSLTRASATGLAAA